MISRIGHVALRVRDLDDAVVHAVEVLGLREVERSDGTVYLTCDTTHHGLQLLEGDDVCFDHAGFEALGADGLARVREMLEREEVPILSGGARELGIRDSVRFAGPGGLVLEVYEGMEAVELPPVAGGVRPVKLQHITFRTDDMDGLERLFGLLGFRLSDRIGDALTWMRCNPDHHGVAFISGGSGLHHYAWEVESWADLERLGDHLLACGKRFMYGPGRHGPGLNLFCYHLDGAGVLVEYAADLQRIYDDEQHVPRDWPMAPESINQWGPGPPEEFMAQLTPAASTSAG